jgi:hypothetical protein
MGTPDGPKNIRGKSVTGRERGAPQRKKGDRVWVQPPNGPRVEPKLGTIEDGPKVSLGSRYLVRYDDGPSITDPPRPLGPQSLDESWLTTADAKAARAGK